MYRARKQWQINQYMSLLVQQGILYFLAIFLFTLMNALAAAGKLGSGLSQLILSVIAEFVPMWTLIPRFIISVRELYARDVQISRGEGIDTGFGLSSGRSAGEKAMVFADVEQDEGPEDVEETQRDIEEIPRDVGTTPKRP
ncbi:hypothetical protein EV363DRAFT_1447915 [Boletus edulis]|nr:hypothetical protein EV363DRAFT_1447915 [Boletus edulis]